MVTDIRYNPMAGFTAMIAVLLMAIGTVFVFSADANVKHELDLQRFMEYPELRQVLYFPLACIIMYTVSIFDYRKLSLSNGWRNSPVIYLLVLSIVLLILVLIPGVGTEKNYARRWFIIPAGPIGKISFQPSELAKWATIFFLAAVCDKFGTGIRSFWKRFAPICAVVGLAVGLIIIEDFGTAAFIALLAFLMLIIAGAKWWHILAPLLFGALAFFTALISSPPRMRRIAAFLSPDKLKDSAAYQANQSRNA